MCVGLSSFYCELVSVQQCVVLWCVVLCCTVRVALPAHAGNQTVAFSLALVRQSEGTPQKGQG